MDRFPAPVPDRTRYIAKLDPPTLGEPSTQTPFASGLGGSELDEAADQTPANPSGLMNAPHDSQQRWIHSDVKQRAPLKLSRTNGFTSGLRWSVAE